MKNSIRVSAIAVGCAMYAFVLCAGCGEPDRFIFEEKFKRSSDERLPAGSVCLNVNLLGAPRDMPPDRMADFVVAIGARDGAVQVHVWSLAETIATRTYDKAFLDSGKVDEFSVRTRERQDYVLRYSGGLGECRPTVRPKAPAGITSDTVR